MSIKGDPIKIFFKDHGWNSSNWILDPADRYYIDKDSCVLLIKVSGFILEIHEAGFFRTFDLSNPRCFKLVEKYLAKALNNWRVISSALGLNHEH